MSKNTKLTSDDTLVTKLLRYFLYFCMICCIALYAVTHDSSYVDYVIYVILTLSTPVIIEIIKATIARHKYRKMMEEEQRQNQEFLAKQREIKKRMIEQEFNEGKGQRKAAATAELSGRQEDRNLRAKSARNSWAFLRICHHGGISFFIKNNFHINTIGIIYI